MRERDICTHTHIYIHVCIYIFPWVNPGKMEEPGGMDTRAPDLLVPRGRAVFLEPALAGVLPSGTPNTVSDSA